MKKARKILLTLCAALLLVTMTVGATVAYLTSTTDVVTNTFTVGNVQITLDETKVDLYGEAVEDNPDTTDVKEDARVTANQYKLMPGHKYMKDPTVHVIAGSERAYVRMFVTINDIEDLKAACDVDVFMPENFVEGWDSTIWQPVSFVQVGDSVVCEFWYKDIVDAREATANVDLDPLFDKIIVPENATNDEIAALEDLEIKVVAQAIQADGFADAETAWSTWEE